MNKTKKSIINYKYIIQYSKQLELSGLTSQNQCNIVCSYIYTKNQSVFLVTLSLSPFYFEQISHHSYHSKNFINKNLPPSFSQSKAAIYLPAF